MTAPPICVTALSIAIEMGEEESFWQLKSINFPGILVVKSVSSVIKMIKPPWDQGGFLTIACHMNKLL